MRSTPPGSRPQRLLLGLGCATSTTDDPRSRRRSRSWRSDGDIFVFIATVVLETNASAIEEGTMQSLCEGRRGDVTVAMIDVQGLQAGGGT
jgi:hypothetical protein